MTDASTRPPAPIARRWRPAVLEALVLVGCCCAYSVACFLAPVTREAAMAHAAQVASFEARTGIDIELAANQWLIARPLIAQAASLQYAVSFFAFTAAALAIMWWRRPDRYHQARNALFVMTGGALVTYWTYPLAPPRLVEGNGIVDAVARHTSAYSSLFGTLANPYGAMPSMHTGWAVWVAAVLGAFVWKRAWQRALLALHPLVTVGSIIATGNHYVVDAVAAVAYFLIACALVAIAGLLRNVRLDRPKS